jgi:hypothetical protein
VCSHAYPPQCEDKAILEERDQLEQLLFQAQVLSTKLQLSHMSGGAGGGGSALMELQADQLYASYYRVI